MSKLIIKLQSPVVLTTIIGGLGILLNTIKGLSEPTVLDIAIAIVVYIGAVLVAMNNPDNKEDF